MSAFNLPPGCLLSDIEPDDAEARAERYEAEMEHRYEVWKDDQIDKTNNDHENDK